MASMVERVRISGLAAWEGSSTNLISRHKLREIANRGLYHHPGAYPPKVDGDLW